MGMEGGRRVGKKEKTNLISGTADGIWYRLESKIWRAMSAEKLNIKEMTRHKYFFRE